jgi:tetratricopeptide (TPR) repeat protein
MRTILNWLGWVLSLGGALTPVFGAIRSTWERGLLRLGRSAASWLAFVFWSVIGWAAARNLRLFFQGLPALAVGASALTVVGFAAFTPTQEIERTYKERAQNAIKAKNLPEAIACYERLAILQADRPEALYDLALSLNANKQPDRCLALMHRLAPPESQGYANAHLWQAVRLMAAAPQTQQMRQIAETHLLRALEGGVDDKELAHGLLGELYFQRGLFQEAEPHLAIAVKKKPNSRLRLAQTYAALGNMERARSEAKLSVNQYSMVAKGDLFAHFARVKWAESVAFLEDFPQAVRILEEGLTGTGEPFYKQHLATIHAQWFDFLGRQGTAPLSQRLPHLEIGLRYDPKNLLLLNRLAMVTSMRHDFRMSPDLLATTWGLAGGISPWAPVGWWNVSAVRDAETARSTLLRMVAEGQGSAQLFFALGVDAWSRGEVKQAAFYWERANEINPDTPVVANNLAFLLMQTSERDLPKALELINRAIEKMPRETNFRDTRGCILVKMGRYREALPDLEAALPQSPNRAGVHHTLAEVYDKLERPELADLHRRLEAEEMAKAKDKK